MSYYSWKKRPPREFKGKPQWTLDEVYISPFTARRRYDEEGVMHYDAIERNLHPTGVEVMDHYLRRLSEGKDVVKDFCKIYPTSCGWPTTCCATPTCRSRRWPAVRASVRTRTSALSSTGNGSRRPRSDAWR